MPETSQAGEIHKKSYASEGSEVEGGYWEGKMLGKISLVGVCVFLASATAALADATSTVSNGDGSTVTVVSVARAGGSWVSVRNKNGKEVSNKFVRDGAGSCEVHKAFLRRYIKAGAKVQSPC